VLRVDRIARKVKTNEDLEKLNEESFYLKFMGRDADRLNINCEFITRICHLHKFLHATHTLVLKVHNG